LIFVTVGGQVPFDRLVEVVDSWARETGRTDVLAQIGTSRLEPRSISWVRFLTPEEYRRTVQSAEVVVSHAGMGTILTALELGTPVIVMPRRAHLAETRNDHQVATMRRLGGRSGIHAAEDERELRARLTCLDQLEAPKAEGEGDRARLIDAVRRFVEDS
jgi:UDP-N-acetylglucosamine transferase subunit ALG13